MDNRFDREKLLTGDDGLKKIARSHVIICGIGGVGSYAAEALARAGVGELTLIDHDRIDPTNINRQIHALTKTIGQYKTEAMKERIYEINPACIVNTKNIFISPESIDDILSGSFDFLIDAIDTVSAKIQLAIRSEKMNFRMISSMGAANKLDAAFQITDIYNTRVCPLAKVMRHELSKAGVKALTVCYSPDTPLKPEGSTNGRRVLGSVSYIPSAAGLTIAGFVFRTLLSINSTAKTTII